MVPQRKAQQCMYRNLHPTPAHRNPPQSKASLAKPESRIRASIPRSSLTRRFHTRHPRSLTHLRPVLPELISTPPHFQSKASAPLHRERSRSTE